jgi:hypothetical protein
MLAQDDKCFYADPEELSDDVALLRGEWVPEATLNVHWAMGRPNPEDVTGGRSIGLFYLSPEVQELLVANGLTGWSTYPIALHNKAGEICPGYAGLSITGRCGPIDEQGGRVMPGQKPGIKYVLRMGLYFDATTWDGSDFFCPEGRNAYMFATERVKRLFEQNAIKRFKFTPLAEATWYPKVP